MPFVASRPGRAGGSASSGAELPIGESDANIFNCPVCARPLAVGDTSLPGLLDAAARGRAHDARGRLHGHRRRSSGVLVTGTIVGGIALLSAPSTAVAVQPDPIVAASAAPVADRRRPAPGTSDPGRAGRALSALSQSNLLNQRLVADEARLEAALSAEPATSVEIARALRALSADRRLRGSDRPDDRAWSDGSEVGAGLRPSTSRSGRRRAMASRSRSRYRRRVHRRRSSDGQGHGAGCPRSTPRHRDLAATADLDLRPSRGTAPAP